MRYHDNGCFYSVSLSRAEVENWARRWPCFGTARAVWFQFDKRSGDLVDASGTDDADGAGVLALSHDAQAWADAYRAASGGIGRRTVTVDRYHVWGTRGATSAAFKYRGRALRSELDNPARDEIADALRALQARHAFTHWRDAHTGVVSLIY